MPQATELLLESLTDEHAMAHKVEKGLSNKDSL